MAVNKTFIMVPDGEKWNFAEFDHTKESEMKEPLFTDSHSYCEMSAHKRPQDESMDGKGWKFETLEHGGEYPDCMPQAIKATDAEGRSCIYVPISVNGRVVDSRGFNRKTESVS